MPMPPWWGGCQSRRPYHQRGWRVNLVAPPPEEPLRDAAAGGPDLLERPLPVARLHLDGPHRGRVDRHAESLAQRVQRRVLHAVVGREPDDRDVVDAALAQQLLELRLLEAGVALLVLVLARVDDGVDQLLVERRMQLGARCSLDAVLGPRAALRGERAMVGRMPVACRD